MSSKETKLRSSSSIAHKIPYFAFAAWIIGSLFFFVEYFIRVSASVLGNTLVETFHTSGVMLGVLFSAFYYAYIVMQLPVGVLMDRFRPRLLMMGAMIVCALACFGFANMSGIWTGIGARFFMGLSAAFAFVGTLKMISSWFPPRTFAIFAGITQALGMIGAFVGEAPMAYVFQTIGWRQTMVVFGILLLVLCLSLFLLGPLRSTHVSTGGKKLPTLPMRQGLALVLKNPFIWLNGVFIAMLYGPTAIFAEQWGPLFMESRFHLPSTGAADVIAWTFIGLTIGCPLMGALSDALKRRVWVMRVSVIMSALCLLMVIYGDWIGINLTAIEAKILLVCYGIFNGGIVPSYAYSAEINEKRVAGVAVGVTNMASVILGALLAPVVGWLLEVFTHEPHLLSTHFSTLDYQKTLIILPLCFLVAFIISFFLKETYCQPYEAGKRK